MQTCRQVYRVRRPGQTPELQGHPLVSLELQFTQADLYYVYQRGEDQTCVDECIWLPRRKFEVQPTTNVSLIAKQHLPTNRHSKGTRERPPDVKNLHVLGAACLVRA